MPRATLVFDSSLERGTPPPHRGRSESQTAGHTEGMGLRTGIGLRAIHHEEIVARRPTVGWLEAHSENYFGRRSAPGNVLAKIRDDYPLSLHGVGLSIGSTDPFDPTHLSEIAWLVRDLEPMLVSEHLSWGSVGGRFTNDLLPLPYTEEALRHMIARVSFVQETLGRQILIENVSSYLQFSSSQLTEWDFLAVLAQESGCALLLDVNNVYVNAMNHGFDPLVFLDHLPRHAVREIHLAGHSIRRVGARDIRIDTHSAPVCDEVWALYSAAVKRFGSVPTLIEWDAEIPALDVLVAEARKADQLKENTHARAA
ncbi:MAG: DUF692 domain-containing protein [Gammaproteobacteria bacterium]